jgi:hypothetical protein
MLFIECAIFCKSDLAIILISPPFLAFCMPSPELYNYLSCVSKHATTFDFRNDVIGFFAFCSTQNGRKSLFDAALQIMIKFSLYFAKHLPCRKLLCHLPLLQSSVRGIFVSIVESTSYCPIHKKIKKFRFVSVWIDNNYIPSAG